MAPFRYAVSLVHGYPRQLLLLVHDFQVLSKAFCGTLLWRDIEKPGEWVARCQVLKQALLFLIWCVSVDSPSSNAGNTESVHLIGLKQISATTFIIDYSLTRLHTIKARRGDMTMVTRKSQLKLKWGIEEIADFHDL